jgi:hypothetical protein
MDVEYKLAANNKTQYRLINSMEKLRLWRECVSNGKLKLLKAPNGLMWIVNINDQSPIEVTWQSSDYPSVISFNWQEVIDKDQITIIKW